MMLPDIVTTLFIHLLILHGVFMAHGPAGQGSLFHPAPPGTLPWITSLGGKTTPSSVDPETSILTIVGSKRLRSFASSSKADASTTRSTTLYPIITTPSIVKIKPREKGYETKVPSNTTYVEDPILDSAIKLAISGGRSVASPDSISQTIMAASWYDVKKVSPNSRNGVSNRNTKPHRPIKANVTNAPTTGSAIDLRFPPPIKTADSEDIKPEKRTEGMPFQRTSELTQQVRFPTFQQFQESSDRPTALTLDPQLFEPDASFAGPPTREDLLEHAIVKNGVKVDIPFEAPPFDAGSVVESPVETKAPSTLQVGYEELIKPEQPTDTLTVEQTSPVEFTKEQPVILPDVLDSPVDYTANTGEPPSIPLMDLRTESATFNPTTLNGKTLSLDRESPVSPDIRGISDVHVDMGSNLLQDGVAASDSRHLVGKLEDAIAVKGNSLSSTGKNMAQATLHHISDTETKIDEYTANRTKFAGEARLADTSMTRAPQKNASIKMEHNTTSKGERIGMELPIISDSSQPNEMSWTNGSKTYNFARQMDLQTLPSMDINKDAQPTETNPVSIERPQVNEKHKDPPIITRAPQQSYGYYDVQIDKRNSQSEILLDVLESDYSNSTSDQQVGVSLTATSGVAPTEVIEQQSDTVLLTSSHADETAFNTSSLLVSGSMPTRVNTIRPPAIKITSADYSTSTNGKAPSIGLETDQTDVQLRNNNSFPVTLPETNQDGYNISNASPAKSTGEGDTGLNQKDTPEASTGANIKESKLEEATVLPDGNSRQSQTMTSSAGSSMSQVKDEGIGIPIKFGMSNPDASSFVPRQTMSASQGLSTPSRIHDRRPGAAVLSSIALNRLTGSQSTASQSISVHEKDAKRKTAANHQRMDNAEVIHDSQLSSYNRTSQEVSNSFNNRREPAIPSEDQVNSYSGIYAHLLSVSETSTSPHNDSKKSTGKGQWISRSAVPEHYPEELTIQPDLGKVAVNANTVPTMDEATKTLDIAPVSPRSNNEPSSSIPSAVPITETSGYGTQPSADAYYHAVPGTPFGAKIDAVGSSENQRQDVGFKSISVKQHQPIIGTIHRPKELPKLTRELGVVISTSTDVPSVTHPRMPWLNTTPTMNNEPRPVDKRPTNEPMDERQKRPASTENVKNPDVKSAAAASLKKGSDVQINGEQAGSVTRAGGRSADRQYVTVPEDKFVLINPGHDLLGQPPKMSDDVAMVSTSVRGDKHSTSTLGYVSVSHLPVTDSTTISEFRAPALIPGDEGLRELDTPTQDDQLPTTEDDPPPTTNNKTSSSNESKSKISVQPPPTPNYQSPTAWQGQSPDIPAEWSSSTTALQLPLSLVAKSLNIPAKPTRGSGDQSSSVRSRLSPGILGKRRPLVVPILRRLSEEDEHSSVPKQQDIKNQSASSVDMSLLNTSITWNESSDIKAHITGSQRETDARFSITDGTVVKPHTARMTPGEQIDGPYRHAPLNMSPKRGSAKSVPTLTHKDKIFSSETKLQNVDELQNSHVSPIKEESKQPTLHQAAGPNVSGSSVDQGRQSTGISSDLLNKPTVSTGLNTASIEKFAKEKDLTVQQEDEPYTRQKAGRIGFSEKEDKTGLEEIQSDSVQILSGVRKKQTRKKLNASINVTSLRVSTALDTGSRNHGAAIKRLVMDGTTKTISQTAQGETSLRTRADIEAVISRDEVAALTSTTKKLDIPRTIPLTYPISTKITSKPFSAVGRTVTFGTPPPIFFDSDIHFPTTNKTPVKTVPVSTGTPTAPIVNSTPKTPVIYNARSSGEATVSINYTPEMPLVNNAEIKEGPVTPINATRETSAVPIATTSERRLGNMTDAQQKPVKDVVHTPVTIVAPFIGTRAKSEVHIADTPPKPVASIVKTPQTPVAPIIGTLKKSLASTVDTWGKSMKQTVDIPGKHVAPITDTPEIIVAPFVDTPGKHVAPIVVTSGKSMEHIAVVPEMYVVTGANASRAPTEHSSNTPVVPITKTKPDTKTQIKSTGPSEETVAPGITKAHAQAPTTQEDDTDKGDGYRGTVVQVVVTKEANMSPVSPGELSDRTSSVTSTVEDSDVKVSYSTLRKTEASFISLKTKTPKTTQVPFIQETTPLSSMPEATQISSTPEMTQLLQSTTVTTRQPSTPEVTQSHSTFETSALRTMPETTRLASTPVTTRVPSTPVTTRVPSTQEMTREPSTPESTWAPSTPETTWAPSTQETTRVPSTPETTRVPSKTETTRVPSTPLTTRVPSTPETARAPSTPETTRVPSTPETTRVPSTPETTRELSTLETTRAPSTPETTQVPSTPETTRVPSTPETTRVPSTPETTQVPSTPETTQVPSTPETTRVPSTSETTRVPFTPETTRVPSTPETTRVPSTPKSTAISSTPVSFTSENTPLAFIPETTYVPTTLKRGPEPSKSESTHVPLTSESTLAPSSSENTPIPVAMSLFHRRMKDIATLLESRGIPVRLDRQGKLQFLDVKTALKSDKPPTTTLQPKTTPKPTTKAPTTTTAVPTTTPSRPASSTKAAVTRRNSPVTIASLGLEAFCKDPSYIDSVGYASYPGQCDKVVQCFKLKGGRLVAMMRECPYGMFWEDSLGLCKHPASVESCSNDPCMDFDLWDYKRGKSCRAYSECYRGVSYPQCCQPDFRYDEQEGCVPHPGCRDPCETPESIRQKLQYSSCKFLPDMANPFGYQTFEHDGVRFRACAPGTMFSASQCGCVAISARVRQRHQMANRSRARNRRRRQRITQTMVKKVCMPDFKMNFDDDVMKELSGTRTAYGVTDVMLSSGAAEFKGPGNIILWGFMDRDLGKAFAIRLRFKVDSNRSSGSIISNCGMHGDPTVKITVDERHVVYRLKSVNRERPVEIRLPYKSRGWNDVVLYYDGTALICGLNNRKAKLPLTGDIETRSNAIYIGGCPAEGDGFEGLIDEVEVYSTCLPPLNGIEKN